MPLQDLLRGVAESPAMQELGPRIGERLGFRSEPSLLEREDFLTAIQLGEQAPGIRPFLAETFLEDAREELDMPEMDTEEFMQTVWAEEPGIEDMGFYEMVDHLADAPSHFYEAVDVPQLIRHIGIQEGVPEEEIEQIVPTPDEEEERMYDILAEATELEPHWRPGFLREQAERRGMPELEMFAEIEEDYLEEGEPNIYELYQDLEGADRPDILAQELAEVYDEPRLIELADSLTESRAWSHVDRLPDERINWDYMADIPEDATMDEVDWDEALIAEEGETLGEWYDSAVDYIGEERIDGERILEIGEDTPVEEVNINELIIESPSFLFPDPDAAPLEDYEKITELEYPDDMVYVEFEQKHGFNPLNLEAVPDEEDITNIDDLAQRYIQEPDEFRRAMDTGMVGSKILNRMNELMDADVFQMPEEETNMFTASTLWQWYSAKWSDWDGTLKDEAPSFPEFIQEQQEKYPEFFGEGPMEVAEVEHPEPEIDYDLPADMSDYGRKLTNHSIKTLAQKSDLQEPSMEQIAQMYFEEGGRESLVKKDVPEGFLSEMDTFFREYIDEDVDLVETEPGRVRQFFQGAWQNIQEALTPPEEIDIVPQFGPDEEEEEAEPEPTAEAPEELGHPIGEHPAMEEDPTEFAEPPEDIAEVDIDADPGIGREIYEATISELGHGFLEEGDPYDLPFFEAVYETGREVGLEPDEVERSFKAWLQEMGPDLIGNTFGLTQEEVWMIIEELNPRR